MFQSWLHVDLLFNKQPFKANFARTNRVSIKKIVYSAHTVFMCFVFKSVETVTFALYNIN